MAHLWISREQGSCLTGTQDNDLGLEIQHNLGVGVNL